MERDKINEMIDARIQEQQDQKDRLIETWQPFIEAADEYTQEKEGHGMSEIEQRNLAQCLENALYDSGQKGRQRLFEATTEDNITFLGVQLPVIAALLPSLVLNDIANIQALDRRIGSVFFLDVKYGSDKGDISSGDTMISAKTGHARSENARSYASQMVKGEAVTGSAGASGSVAVNVTYRPGVDVTRGTVVIKNGSGVVIGTDRASAGTITGTNCTGTLNTAGALSIAPVTTWDSSGVTIDYEYQYDRPIDTYNDYYGVPQANFEVTAEDIKAKDFMIRSLYSVGAAIDLQKAHGISLENEVVKFLGGEVRFTIDHFGIDMIDKASLDGVYVNNVLQTPATGVANWDATVGSGQEWVWVKQEFMDRIELGNINIIKKTLRGCAAWMVVGNNVARVVKQLPGDMFKPVANLNRQAPTGPIKIGDLDGRPVIHDPLLPARIVSGAEVSGDNRYFMGWKGDNFLRAGMIYCPYIPLFASPTLTTSDLYNQKGFLSAAGFKIINAGLFCHGTVSNVGIRVST